MASCFRRCVQVTVGMKRAIATARGRGDGFPALRQLLLVIAWLPLLSCGGSGGGGGSGEEIPILPGLAVTPEVLVSGDTTIVEGDSADLTATFTGDGATGPYTASLDWGDGTVVGATIDLTAGDPTITASHTYVDDGTYEVSVSITDASGAHGGGSRTVTVENSSPTVIAGPVQNATVGTDVLLAPAVFADAGSGDTHTATIAWGDGVALAGTVVEADGLGTVDGSHRYPTVGTYTGTVTVADDDGGTDADTFTVTVVAVGEPLGNEPPPAVSPDPETPCDLDADGDVDRDDIEMFVALRGQTAAPGDPLDMDGDGEITVYDARLCVAECTNPHCDP